MTQDERNLLTDLANKISQTPAPPKDPEAEEFIRTRIGSRPDALYLMTQTVLVQNIALQNAQQQIRDLQQRTSQPAQSSGSFLGGGGGQPSGYSQGSASYSAPGSQYAPAASPQYAPPSPSQGGSSFLRGAAQTAAGVAAGTLAADAISSMFTHHGGFGGGYGGGGFMDAPVEETVVNNYYDTNNPPPDNLRVDDRGADNFADPGQSFDDTQYDDSNSDAGLDDGGFDNSSGDDFS